MVVSYLEKLREEYQEEHINISTKLSIANNELRETVEILKVLELNIDRNFEAFTPRQVDGFNKRKIEELKVEQTNIEEKISMLQTKLMILDDKLTELNKVIKVAKENDKLLRELEK